MPFTAVRKDNGKYICLYSKKIQEAIHNRRVFTERLETELVCPNCGKELHLTRRPNTRWYFRHLRHGDDTLCTESLAGGRDTADNQINHQESVIAIIEYLESNILHLNYEKQYGEVTFVTEYPFKQIKRRSDICVLDSNNNPVVVHEIQLSSITSEEIIARTNDYESIGINCVWHFGLKAQKDQDLIEWFIRKYGYVSTPFQHYYNESVLGIAH